MNQCDGCRTKSPLKNSKFGGLLHCADSGLGFMGCEAYRYTVEFDQQFNEAHEAARKTAKEPVRILK